MSSDNQFTALGPTIVGFQTDGANIDRGADIGGKQVGVKGTCIGPVGDGVQGHGTGNFSGVAGFGGGDANSAGTGVIGLGGVQTGDLFAPQRGPGVRGIGGGGPITSPSSSGVGVFGQGAPQGPGIVGQAGSGNTDGVQGFGSGSFSGVAGFGGGNSGTGAFGLGGGTAGHGVRGIGAGAGYGGMFEGGQAPLRLIPSDSAGQPTSGSHLVGEFYVDSTGALFYCRTTGTPGVWVKLA